MITPFLLLALLDFQKPPVTDPLGKQFVVTELAEQSTTGRTTNPSSGGPNNHYIEIDFVNHDDPHEGTTAVSTLPTDDLYGAVNAPVVPAMIPYDPPGTPESPLPETPPVAVVPEPSTMAILTVSGIVLIYLLFGRQKKQRLYRRT